MNMFITATGTDIGKTFVACTLLSEARRRQLRSVALKPVISGFDRDYPERTDAGLLLRTSASSATTADIDRMSPWRFEAPLSPDRAAETEGFDINYQELVMFCRRAAGQRDLCIVEGAGGVHTPVGRQHSFLDLMSDLQMPVLLVTGTYLGTLSHTFAALDALTERRLQTFVCVNQSDEDTKAFDEVSRKLTDNRQAAVFKMPRVQEDQASAWAGPILDHLSRLDL